MQIAGLAGIVKHRDLFCRASQQIIDTHSVDRRRPPDLVKELMTARTLRVGPQDIRFGELQRALIVTSTHQRDRTVARLLLARRCGPDKREEHQRDRNNEKGEATRLGSHRSRCRRAFEPVNATATPRSESGS